MEERIERLERIVLLGCLAAWGPCEVRHLTNEELEEMARLVEELKLKSEKK